MARYLKTLSLIWGLLWMGMGGLAGLAFLIAAAESSWETSLALAVPIAAGVGGGGLVTYAAARALGKSPARPMRLPPAWALAGGFVLALAAGLGLWQGKVSEAFLMPIFVAAAAVLAPLAVASWLLRDAGRPGDAVSRRRGLVALGLGSTAGVALAFVLNTLLAGAGLALVFGLARPALDIAGGAIELLTGGLFGGRWATIDLIAVLIEIAVLVPLTEEMVKPLAILPLLKRLPTPRDALLLGALAGAGFAAVENLLYAAMLGEHWGGVLAVRSLGAALHPFGAGLMAMAWWGVLRREPRAGSRWLRNYGIAVGAHAVWNGTSAVAAALAGAWLQGWEVDLLGVTDGALLLALLAVEGIGILLALRAIARQTAPAGDIPKRPAMPTERAVAVWAVVCLVVLLPVGLGLLRTLW